MYFPDLATHRYTGSALPNVFTVGWLDRDHDVPTGDVAPHLLEKLKLLAIAQPANPMRGLSECELCGLEDVPIEAEGVSSVLGSAEIWIPKATDRTCVFAAPNMIVHYVEAHSYLPPGAFLEALDAVDPGNWNGTYECERILRDHGVPI